MRPSAGRLTLSVACALTGLGDAAFAPTSIRPASQPALSPRARAPTASLLSSLSPAAEEQLSSFSAAIAEASGTPPSFDVLDLVLVSPIFVGLFAVWALSSTFNAGSAIADKAKAASEKAAAESAAKRTASKAEALAKKVEEEQQAKERKIQFFNKRLSDQRKEMEEKAKKQTENLRKDLSRNREKVRAAEKEVRELRAELRKAQQASSSTATPAAPSPAPPPPPPSPPAVISVGTPAATEPPPLKLAKSISGGVTKLQAGVQAGDVVVVTGASGRTGKLVVAELLAQYPKAKVRAAVRDLSALQAAFPKSDPRLELVACDLYDQEGGAFEALFKGASAVVWCASSFGQSEASDAVAALVEKALLQLDPTAVLDAGGVRIASSKLGESTALLAKDAKTITPKFVLLSSAAVMRPSWDADTKKLFAAAADIPIVSLNPKNILGLKGIGEAALRESGLPYCIVRPCGLNEEQPSGRLILSSGDVATGRIGRADLAALLASVLSEPAATGKTVEVLSLPGLPKVDLSPVFETLGYDSGAQAPAPDPTAYSILRQLTPEAPDGAK